VIIAEVHGRGISLSLSANPRSDLKFLQTLLDIVACIQGKAADTGEKPADPDKYAGEYDLSHQSRVHLFT
jgi:hypothetical protein